MDEEKVIGSIYFWTLTTSYIYLLLDSTEEFRHYVTP